eukprot:2808823-Pleurochrysis_carterae.AAC.2
MVLAKPIANSHSDASQLGVCACVGKYTNKATLEALDAHVAARRHGVEQVGERVGTRVRIAVGQNPDLCGHHWS